MNKLIDIPWYEWLYSLCTETWRVKSERIWRYLKPYKAKTWHSQIALRKEWRSRTLNISRVVWITFLWLNINDRHIYVCHKSEELDKDWFLNNSLDNLWLWTHTENIKDMHKKWRVKWWPSLNWNTSEPIIQYTKEWKFIKKWTSMSEVKRMLSIDPWCISYCCTWKRKSAWWFMWRYDKGS